MISFKFKYEKTNAFLKFTHLEFSCLISMTYFFCALCSTLDSDICWFLSIICQVDLKIGWCWSLIGVVGRRDGMMAWFQCSHEEEWRLQAACLPRRWSSCVFWRSQWCCCLLLQAGWLSSWMPVGSAASWRTDWTVSAWSPRSQRTWVMF